MKPSDAPWFFLWAAWSLFRGRARFAGRLFKLALAALALSGCATTKYATVYCLSHDQQLPAEPPKIRSELNGDAAHDVGPLAGSAIRLRAWGEGLQSVLNGCREPSPK